jgi:hypothetical protein
MILYMSCYSVAANVPKICLSATRFGCLVHRVVPLGFALASPLPLTTPPLPPLVLPPLVLGAPPLAGIELCLDAGAGVINFDPDFVDVGGFSMKVSVVLV